MRGTERNLGPKPLRRGKVFANEVSSEITPRAPPRHRRSPPRDTGDESPKSADRHFISADRKMWYLPISQGGIGVPNWQGGSDLQAFLIVFVVVICVRTSPDPPTHRSSFYVSSHVGTEICARQMLGNNICLHAPTVDYRSPLLVYRKISEAGMFSLDT